MSVRRINDWWYVDFRFDHTRYRVRCPSNSRADALNYESLLISRLCRGIPLHGEPPPPPKPAFAEVAERWLATSAASYSSSHRRAAEYAVRGKLGEFFGRMPVDTIGPEAIERFKAQEIRRGLSPATVNGTLSILKACLDFAMQEGHRGSPPTIRRMRMPPGRFNVLSEEETARLLSDRSDRPAAEMAFMAVHTGMRVGEVLALMWEDVDLEHGEVLVRQSVSHGELGPTKNYRERRIPLVPAVVELLKNKDRLSRFVFVDEKSRPLTYGSACGRLQRLCARVGLRNIGWHALRHTFASTLAAGGAPVTAIQQLLGHASVETTMRYTHVSHSSLKDAVTVLA